jgi:hypothetical protein
MSRLRLAGFAGLLVVAALVGGTIIGSVAARTLPQAAEPVTTGVAAPSAAAPATASRVAEYCADFRRAFAANLGVEESALAPAARKAAIATIDAAVASGELQAAAAERLKKRIEATESDVCALLAGKVGAFKAAGAARSLGVVKNGVTAAAKALGITPAELGAELRGGKSLKEIADTKGVPVATVTAAVLAAVKADLDEAVKAGTLKQARADRILVRLERNLADGRLRNARPERTVAPAGSPAPAPGS